MHLACCAFLSSTCLPLSPVATELPPLVLLTEMCRGASWLWGRESASQRGKCESSKENRNRTDQATQVHPVQGGCSGGSADMGVTMLSGRGQPGTGSRYQRLKPFPKLKGAYHLTTFQSLIQNSPKGTKLMLQPQSQSQAPSPTPLLEI